MVSTEVIPAARVAVSLRGSLPVRSSMQRARWRCSSSVSLSFWILFSTSSISFIILIYSAWDFVTPDANRSFLLKRCSCVFFLARFSVRISSKVLFTGEGLLNLTSSVRGFVLSSSPGDSPWASFPFLGCIDRLTLASAASGLVPFATAAFLASMMAPSTLSEFLLSF